MEDHSINSLIQKASKNTNINDQTINDNNNENENQTNSNTLNTTTSDNKQYYSDDILSQSQIKSNEHHTTLSTPTVIVELGDDDNEKPHQNLDQDISSNTESDNGAINRFLLSNLNQGQTFINDDTESFTTNTENQQNENPNTILNDRIIPRIIPELTRSEQSDPNLLESKTPSNVTTEENSPKSRPFSPDITQSPMSPPHIEKFDQVFENDEARFKTLSVNGNDEENHNSDNEFYKRENENTSNNENNRNNNQTEAPKLILRLTSNPHLNALQKYDTQTNEYAGLQNQGATCYMNSMLQALYHLPIFRRFIYKMDYSEAASDEQNIPLNLQRLFAMMQLRIRSSIPTKELTNSFGWSIHETYTQHDVQEFCRVILDNIESKMKKQENLKDAIGYLFRGKMKSEIRLKTDEIENSTTEEFYDLSMVVKDTNSLEESFQKYIEPETISDYDTETGKQDITKTLEFVQFPHVLYIHLRRFEYDPEIQNMKKINSRFEFPETMDLSQFLADDADQTESQIFDLFGVLVHNGGSYSGHYFAYLRPSGDEDRWFLFNDSSVSEVKKEEAIEANYGGVSDSTAISFERSYSAYMLIYIRRSRIPEFYEKVTDSEIPESAARYAQEKKEKYERQLEEKRRIENTISFKLFGDEDIRKNALNCNISFNFHKNKLTNIDAMKYESPDDLYEKVAALLKLNKFALYEVDSTYSFEEINRDTDIYLQSLYCKYIYVYTNFKENRIIERQKYRAYHRNHRQGENENNNDNDDNEDNNDDNGESNNNNENNNNNNTGNIFIDNDNNEEEDKNQFTNKNEDESNNEYTKEEEEEEEEEEDNSEEEEYDNENDSYSLFLEENSTILVFYFVFIQNERFHPIRFWKADRVKTKWKSSRIYNKSERAFKDYPNNIYYKLLNNDKYKYLQPDSRLNMIKSGTILIIEIKKSYLPQMMRYNDERILQMFEEEEEEEEEENIINYLHKFPPKTFQEYITLYPKQITFKIIYDKNTSKLIKVPYKIQNDKFIKFIKTLFKVSKFSFVVFYDEKSRTPYNIEPNQNTLDNALKGPNDTVMYAYPVSQAMSYSLFKDNFRILYFTGDGYFQYRTKKHCFISDIGKVQDLIDQKIYNSIKKTKNRLITIYDNKITVEEPDNLISELRGRIRIEEVPEEMCDNYIQLMISKDVAKYLDIFNNNSKRNSKKLKYTRSIECLFPIYENEMFQDTKRRIVETFNCNESKLGDISFQMEDPNSYNKYPHTLTDIDTLTEMIDIDSHYFYIIYLEIIQQDIGSIPLPKTMQSRNNDSIFIQN